ncbi:NB-ARC domain-containing protein [Amycolatopsis regifaucium]|uniref:Uncharacterized protein n=1 Tax=Amycolatopsis regifaucium TaxID=546365 RepID=A0A154M3V1_9PSEU|nr:NB-ARC domain-containing protein [Amycolatopsis regifaucium]KZB79291.1 hypothetical protein AVL48_17005 [Amycolatopsis regifaucium]OKA07473.1 hypothetical protein ATP06_0216690 [Amycolatopsis regifaucium]SFH10716.1 Tfp pilus assembly protein PilF [Amycolatopsis regifaucium]
MSTERGIHGPVQGLVVGDHNRVEIVLPPGESVPFMAPPRPRHSLIGRTEALDALRRDVLAGHDSALFALKGIPGVGKTALAIALAHDPRVGGTFIGGVLWAGLGPSPDVMTLLANWGAALGIPAEQLATAASPQARAQIVHLAIGLRRMLLIVDDAWSLEAALAFRLGGPNCVHLLTTRIPAVATRFAAKATDIKELQRDASLRLLTRLAPEAAEADPAGVGDLVDLVSGLPLALILIGNHLRTRSAGGSRRRVRETIVRLRDAKNRLTVSEPRGLLDSGAYDTPLSLAASIQVSDAALPDEGRRALRDITAFPAKPNSFGEDAAADVLERGFEDIDLLVDLGLLEHTGDQRYTLHQAIHDYAHADGPTTRARERLARHYVHSLEATRMPRSGSTRPDGLDEGWSADTANVLTALDYAQERGLHEELVSGANDFAEHLNRRGLLTQAQLHLERALAVADRVSDVDALTRTRINLAGVYQQRGELRAAEDLLDKGLGKGTDAARGGLRFDALLKLGWVRGRLGKVSEARAALSAALDIHDEIDRPGGRAAALMGLGWLDTVHGRQAEAAESLVAALEVARSTGEKYQIADILQRVGWLEGMRGRREQAQEAFAEAASVARENGFPTVLVDALNGLGWLDGLRGDYGSARVLFEEAIAFAEATGYAERYTLLGGLAWVVKEEGDFADARARYEEALVIAREKGETEKTSLFLAKLAELEVLLGEPGNARVHAREAVDLARELHLPDRLVDPLRTLATIARGQGLPERALSFLDEATGPAREIGNDFLLADVANETGLAHLDLGRLETAEEFMITAADHARRADAGDALGRALFGRAKLALARDDLAGVRAFVADALRVLDGASPALAREVSAWRDQVLGSST